VIVSSLFCCCCCCFRYCCCFGCKTEQGVCCVAGPARPTQSVHVLVLGGWPCRKMEVDESGGLNPSRGAVAICNARTPRAHGATTYRGVPAVLEPSSAASALRAGQHACPSVPLPAANATWTPRTTQTGPMQCGRCPVLWCAAGPAPLPGCPVVSDPVSVQQ